MRIFIDKKNIENMPLDAYKKSCGAALDSLWETGWIRMAISKSDRKPLSALQEIADRLAYQSSVVLVIAEGAAGRMIRGLTDAVPGRSDRASVEVFGDTLSSVDYARLLDRLESEDFSILAVTEGKEGVPWRGAFACLKKLLITKYGPEAAAARICGIAGKNSDVLAKDAADNDYPLINWPEGISAAAGAGTAAALLPLAVKGVNLEEYLDGFYDMLADPAWDLDGTDYGAARAIWQKEHGGGENLMIWQRQLLGLGKWRDGSHTIWMPEEQALDRKADFAAMLIVEMDEEDVMMPYFEGCNEDGSLNLLLKETADRYFRRDDMAERSVKISVERLDSYSLGHLAAFLQLSDGITDFLLKK